LELADLGHGSGRQEGEEESRIIPLGTEGTKNCPENREEAGDWRQPLGTEVKGRKCSGTF
jgi:hypothetical protein